MIKNLLWISTLLLIGLPLLATSATDPIDCVVLEHGETFEVELKSDNNFLNCFRFDGLDNGDNVTLYSASTGNITYEMSVFEFENANAERRATISSDNNVATYRSSAESNSMGFRINPTNNLTQNKSLTVRYSRFSDGEVVAFIEIVPVVSTVFMQKPSELFGLSWVLSKVKRYGL